MSKHLLALLLLIAAPTHQSFDHKCLQSFLNSQHDPTCDFKSFIIIQKHLQNIFEEIYGKFPVNVKCIEEKTSQKEISLGITLLHVSEENLDDEDKSEISQTLAKLFHIMLHKILMCYDSEMFFQKRSEIYENVQDENVRNCIEKSAIGDSFDAKCFEIIDVIYEALRIDEIFFESSNFVSVGSIMDDTKKCLAFDIEDEKKKLFIEVSKMLASKGQAEASSRGTFDSIYISFTKNIIECLENHNVFAHFTTQKLVQRSPRQKILFEFSNLLNFFLSLNLIYFSLFVIIMFLCVLASGERRDRYRYERIN